MAVPPSDANPLQILIVENNPADARLTLEALKQAGMHDAVVTRPTGDEALSYLRREGEHANKPTPHLIFLDLHLRGCGPYGNSDGKRSCLAQAGGPNRRFHQSNNDTGAINATQSHGSE